MGEGKPSRFRRPRLLLGRRGSSGLVPELSDRQLLIVALVLVVLVAMSMLYCLGFASLAVRDNWQRAPLPWNGTAPVEQIQELLAPAEPGAATTPP